MRRKKHQKENISHPIVLISAPLSTGEAFKTLEKEGIMDGLDYFSVLVSELAQRIHSQDRDLVLKVPAPRKVDDEQIKLFNRIIDRIDNYSGIIISPFSTDSLKRQVIRFLEINKLFPICTIDKGFERHFKDFETRHVFVPPFVTCDNFQGGELAADCFIEYFKKKVINRPKIGIIKGLEASEERIGGFIKRLNNGLGKNSYMPKVSEPISYQRIPAIDATREILEYFENGSNRITQINSIFCCNDEMALGAREALIQYEYMLKAKGIQEKLNVKIVGFDGIRDVTYLIDKKDRWILNTIDQMLPEQVRELITIMEEFIENPQGFIDKYKNKREKIFQKIKCDYYLKPINQHMV